MPTQTEINILTNGSDAHETVFGIRDDTVSRGIDMDGAQITAIYADGSSETLVWQALDRWTNGGATGANIEMFYGWRDQQLTTSKLLTSLKINLKPSSSVFDMTLTAEDSTEGENTPTSFEGFPFRLAPEFEQMGGRITATYSGIVNLIARPAEGDLYTTLTLDFSGLPDRGLLGSLQWAADIDTMRYSGDLVPVGIHGSSGRDALAGTPEQDFMFGGGANDTINGGSEIDTAAYSGVRGNYTLTLSKNATTLTDRQGSEGRDTLINIEKLAFADQMLNLDDYTSLTQLSSSQFSDLAKVYVAYFGRAADAEGLYFWADKLAEGMDLHTIASYFSQSVEARTLYPNTADTSGFVSAVYANVLGRTPDQAGYDFWTTHLNDGSLSPATFVLSVIEGAQGADITYLSRKADLGVYFSAIKGMSDVTDAQDVLDIFGDQATSNAQGAKTSIDNYFSEASSDESGEFIFNLVGVVDDPFAGGL